jgi:hypothetical protein
VPAKHYDRYMAPAYPAVALWAGHGMSLLLSERARRAAPTVVLRLAVAAALLLALVPIPLHTYQCTGFGEARGILDAAAPGRTVAWYVAPGKRPSWGVRAKSIYYMDRTPVPHTDVRELDRAGVDFVMADARMAPDLEAAGFRDLLGIDSKRRLFLRRGGETRTDR